MRMNEHIGNGIVNRASQQYLGDRAPMGREGKKRQEGDGSV